MTHKGEVHVGDVGVRIGLELREGGSPLDLSTASAKQIRLQKPDGTVLTPTTLFETDGSEGKIYVNTASAWLNQSGMWRKQARVTIGSQTHNTDIVDFYVHEALT